MFYLFLFLRALNNYWGSVAAIYSHHLLHLGRQGSTECSHPTCYSSLIPKGSNTERRQTSQSLKGTRAKNARRKKCSQACSLSSSSYRCLIRVYMHMLIQDLHPILPERCPFLQPLSTLTHASGHEAIQSAQEKPHQELLRPVTTKSPRWILCVYTKEMLTSLLLPTCAFFSTPISPNAALG